MAIRRWLRELTASTNDLEVLRAIDATEPCSIGDLAEDTPARIVGVVGALDEQRVTAPLSGRRVLSWGVKIESNDIQARRTGRLPFVLLELGHRALIEPESSRILISATSFTQCRGLDGADDLQLPFLLDAGATDPPVKLLYTSLERSRPSKYRFSEWVIEPGMVLAVAGSGIREHDLLSSGGDYRERPTWIRISGSPERPIAITDEIDL